MWWVCETFFFNCRVFLALSENPRDRGTIVAEGGGKVSYFSCLNTSNSQNKTGKTGQEYISVCSRLFTQALIPIALEGTEAGKVKASHALAKIAAISNPEIAFPGERVSQLFFAPPREENMAPR